MKLRLGAVDTGGDKACSFRRRYGRESVARTAYAAVARRQNALGVEATLCGTDRETFAYLIATSPYEAHKRPGASLLAITRSRLKQSESVVAPLGEGSARRNIE